jgi:maltose alpha-D-glucosyltransferase / alpha-amylase
VSELTETTLDDVLALARSASSRYRTLRARVRDWTNYDRVAQLQGVAATGVEDEEHFVRLFARSGDGVREQGHGWVRLNDDALYRVLLEPAWLAESAEPSLRGRARVAGRAGYLVETGGPGAGGEGFELLPGANRCEYVVDAERGVLLRAAAFLDDEPLMVEEMVSVDFDAALDDGLFSTRAERRPAATGSEQPGHWFESNPLWFKTAVFYEIHIRGFFDGNDDGSGDFRGLIEKLDYLQWLGVDCIWLLPMYASPLRDGGYDISDYEAIHPDYGNVEDFRAFVEASHQRGIRVIADLVMNHTSSDHPWFQEARSSKDSPKRDWYVWSDSDERWSEARIIFLDTEASNWTWDPVSEQYYWHRFFSHQPDLNYDNPEVQEAMLDALRFWLDLGIDGFRLDAVPYLYERDGTNGENLAETHEFLKRVRTTVDAEYPDRVLLAEANQWPADVVEYFGEGDECHMAFHFPVMPRMFMALRREEALPVIEILEQTPTIPDNAQWGLFLRNHDELTLEMVTDEERDYMYAEYAKDPRMRLNLGIRRRLAPLLDNGRDEIELMTAILFSLPGSPVLYYGDEIGMGDNIYLGDRDGVRTPMQWTGDRNGGFSRADFAQLYLPPLMDPVWGFQATNVEAQLRTPTSLLRWLHRFIGLRKAHPVFGLGTYEVLRPANTKIFAHVRRWEDDIVLCVHNVARSAQAVELDLSQFAGHVPEEMFGHSRFPAIGELPYLLTLAPRGFFWFLLRPPESE